MDNKGFVTTTVSVSIMMICLSFLGVFYATIQMRNVQIGLTEPVIVESAKNRTATERLYGVFNEDMLRTAPIVFDDDLPITYTIETLSYEYPKRHVSLTQYRITDDGQEQTGTQTILLEHLPPSERPTDNQVIRLTHTDSHDH